MSDSEWHDARLKWHALAHDEKEAWPLRLEGNRKTAFEEIVIPWLNGYRRYFGREVAHKADCSGQHVASLALGLVQLLARGRKPRRSGGWDRHHRKRILPAGEGIRGWYEVTGR
jgi:hypothetical protein